MRHKYLILVGVFALVAVADQGAKYLAVSRLTNALDHANAQSLPERVVAFYTLRNLDNDPWEPGGIDYRRAPAVVVPGLWQNKYVENPGAAWGLLSRVSETWRVPFFHVISLMAILIIVAFYRRLEADHRLMAFALSLVLGGAVGNYLDRLARGYVIDFVDLHWKNRPDLHWPTFNVADSAICVGVVLMLGETILGARKPQIVTPSEPATAPAGGAPPPAANPDSLPSAEPGPRRPPDGVSGS
jgi:signal peptidase II